MKIHALEWGGVPQPIVWEPSGLGGGLVIRGRQHPHHTSAAATASSASLGQPCLPEPWAALGGWAATIEACLRLRPQLGSCHPRLACASGQPWAAGGLRAGPAALCACCPPTPVWAERTVGLQQG
uniref:Uncharacterized protein n=1 Tax=Myotis myotis TaxID=51298 RepID=A0A7J7WHV1_MYOMY|nr:hypothetical protein mMyoMyo1_012131 [Myotis myotis]